MDLPAAEPRSRLSRLTPWLVAAAVALVIAATVLALRLIAPTSSLDLDTTGRVAVLPLANATGEREHEWLRLGLMEMIVETLRRSRGVEVVDPERLPRVAAARGVDTDDEDMRPRARELAVALGAELVIDAVVRKRTGRRGASDDDLYALHFDVLDAAGSALAGATLRGADPTILGERLAYLVADALAGRAEPVTMRRVFSQSPFLNRLYGMGLAALRGAGPRAARPYFEIAAEMQPGFLAARYAAAECARREGDLEESRRIVLAAVVDAQNRGERAWETRGLHAAAVLEALAGDDDKAVVLATQVRSLMAKAGDRAAEAAVLLDLARFALAGGDSEHAAGLFGEAGDLQEETGDDLGRIDTLAQLGTLALRAGDLDAAKDTLDEARVLSEALGDVRAEMQVLANLGEVAARRGQNATAVDLWRRAVTYYEQRGEASRQLYLKRDIAEALLREEELDAAEEAFQDMRELAVRQGDENLEALAEVRLTFVLLRRGYPFQARRHLDRAVELDRRLDEPLTLQRLIAWMAYEEGNYRLAYNALAAVKRQAGESWRDHDEDFLRVFAEALERGERLPVPGESRALGPGA